MADDENKDSIQLLGAIEVAKREVLIKLAEEEPWLFADDTGLYHMIKKMPNGKKTFTLAVQDGQVTEVSIHTSIKHNYKKRT